MTTLTSRSLFDPAILLPAAKAAFVSSTRAGSSATR